MVGGGQLARMTAAAAVGLGARFRVLSESENESAALVTRDVTVGSHLSLPDVTAFAAECDVITFDHEHVPGPILAKLESDGVLVRCAWLAQLPRKHPPGTAPTCGRLP